MASRPLPEPIHHKRVFWDVSRSGCKGSTPVHWKENLCSGARTPLLLTQVILTQVVLRTVTLFSWDSVCFLYIASAFGFLFAGVISCWVNFISKKDELIKKWEQWTIVQVNNMWVWHIAMCLMVDWSVGSPPLHFITGSEFQASWFWLPEHHWDSLGSVPTIPAGLAQKVNRTHCYSFQGLYQLSISA